MQRSHQLQRRPGKMLAEEASLPTLLMLLTTSSSFIFGLEVLFLKSLGRNMFAALYSNGAVILRSLT
jgi:hypothetical protein